MREKFLFLSILILTGTSVCAADIVSRAETTDLRFSDGKVVPRVERDTLGNVVGLRLNGMELNHDEVAELGRLEYLRRLSLFRTKVFDRDVAQLKGCRNLEHLNLTGTEITDDAIDTIVNLRMLKTVCLGNVNVSPEALEKLKEVNRSRDRDGSESLRWGYSQRRTEP